MLSRGAAVSPAILQRVQEAETAGGTPAPPKASIPHSFSDLGIRGF